MDRETLVSRVYEVGLLLRRQRKLSFHPLELEEFYKFYFHEDPPYADHGFRDFEALLAQSEEFFFRSTEGNFSCLLKECYELKHRIPPNSATKPKLVDLTDPLAPARSESSQSTLGDEDGDFALDGSIPEADVQTAPDDQMTEHDKEEGISDEKIPNSAVMHEKIAARAVLEESAAEASAERKSPEKKVNTVAIDKNVIVVEDEVVSRLMTGEQEKALEVETAVVIQVKAPSGPPDERPVFYGPEPIDGSGTDSKSLPSPSSLVTPVAVETDSRKEQTVATRGEEAISRKKNPILEKVRVVEKAPEEPIRQVIQEQQKDSEEQHAMQYEDDDDTSFTVRFRGDELERNREKMATTRRSAEKVASSSYRPEAPPRQEEDRYHYGYNHNEASVRYGRDSGERRRQEEFEDYGRGVQQRARQEQHYDYNQDHYNHHRQQEYQRQEVPVRFNEEYQGAGRRPDERNYPEQRQRLQEPPREVVSVRYGRNSGGQYEEDQQEFNQRNHQEQNYQRHHQNHQKYAHPDIPTRFPTDSDGYEEYHQEYHAGRRPDERTRQEQRHHYQEGSSGEHHQEERHQPNLVNQEYYPESPRQEAAVRAPTGSGVSEERQVLRQREDPRVRGVMYQEHFRKENAARNRREASPPHEDEDVQGRQLIARTFLETVESYVKHYGGVVKFTELFTVLREREKEVLEAFAEEYGQEIICSSMERAFYLENHEGEYIVSLSKEIAEQAKQQAKVVSGLNSSLRRLNGELYLVDVYTGAYDNCRHFHHFLHESRIDYDSFEKIATSYFDVTEDERRGGFLKISLTADQRAENFVDEWEVDEEEEEENGDVVVEDRRDTNSRSRLNHEIPPPRRGESGGPEGHRQEPGRRTNERDRQEPRHQRESRESPRRQENYEIPPRHGADEPRRRPIVPQQAQNAVEYGPEPPPQDPTPMPSVEVFMKATRRILREFQGHVLLPELNQAFQKKFGIAFHKAFFEVTGTTKYHLIKEMSNGKILSGFSGQGPEDVWFRLRSTSPEQNVPQNAPPAPVILAVPPPISSIHHEKITLKDVTKRVILVLETKKGEAIDDEVSNAYRKMFPGSELERDLFSQVPLVTGVATLVTCSGGKIAARFDDNGHVRYKLKGYVPLRLAPPAAQDRANEPHNRRGANTEAEVVTVESDSEEEQRRPPAPPKRPEAPRQPTALEKELYGPFVAAPLTSLQPREIVERVIDLFEDDVHAMDVERMEELYRGQFGEELKRFLQPLYGNKDNWMRELVKASKDKLEIQMMGRSGWAIKLKGATQQAAQNRRRNVRMARDQRKMNRRITELEAATKRRAERRRRDSSVERVRRSSRSDSRSRSRSISPRRNRRRGDRDDSDERSARRRSRSKSRSKSRSSSPKRRGFRETPDVERVRRSSRSDSRSRSRSISPKRSRRRDDSDERSARRMSRSKSRSSSPKRNRRRHNRDDSEERNARRRSPSRSRSPKRRGFRETPDKGNVGRRSRSRSRSRSPRRRRRGGRDSERRRSNSSSPRSRSPKRRGFRKEREDRERRGSTILVSSSDEEQRRRRQQRKEVIDVSDDDVDDEIQFVDHRSML